MSESLQIGKNRDTLRNDRVIKGMAVLGIVALVGIGLGATQTGDIAAYAYETSDSDLGKAIAMTEFGVLSAELGFMMTAAAVTGPAGWAIGGMIVGGML